MYNDIVCVATLVVSGVACVMSTLSYVNTTKTKDKVYSKLLERLEKDKGDWYISYLLSLAARNMIPDNEDDDEEESDEEESDEEEYDELESDEETEVDEKITKLTDKLDKLVDVMSALTTKMGQ